MIVSRNHTGHRTGQCHGNAKLTDSQVAEMRRLRSANEKSWSYAKLAKRFRCGESTARDIVQYRTRWAA